MADTLTRKGHKTMTPNGNTPQTPETKTVTRTVFDLAAFDDVKLVKTMTLPVKPTSVEEALAAVGNNPQELLNVIYEGLVGKAQDAAYKNIEGFQVIDEDGKPAGPYTGRFADEETGKKINLAILALAKIQGWDKSMSPAKKNELKERATEFLRSNPAMLTSIQGAPAPTEPTPPAPPAPAEPATTEESK